MPPASEQQQGTAESALAAGAPEATFPDGFLWGAATSAYQIEGGRNEEGKGDSIWDRFSDQGRLRAPGDVACDHFHRWREDVDLIAGMGANAYRFSVSWPRVVPDGSGWVNQEGLDFYRRLVAALRDHEITPVVTLYHWDLPQELQEKGGWAERSTVDAFARFACLVAGALGEETGYWITQNEPWVAAMLGHRDGVFAPGVSEWPTALTVAHHLLVAHGLATHEIRNVVGEAKVGIALDCRPAQPASDSERDEEAARHFDGFRNRWFFDPVFGRGYPEDMMRVYREKGRIDSDVFHEDDQEMIAAPIDFLGLNYYTTVTVAAGAEERDEPEAEPGPDPAPGFTEMGWRIDPSGLSSYLQHLHATYSPPSIVISENGASFSDGPDEDGVIDDQRRIAYLQGHVRAVAEARQAGVPVDGYFVWSLMDNLEWLEGFAQRFGLIWIDQNTLDRVPKRSYDWYRRLATTGTLPVA